jgi:magnesium-transporting ATPase (P-type)
MYQFWLSCAACNDILVIEKNGEVEYHGSSTDEMTLVEAAANNGFKLIYRAGDTIRV